MTKSKSLCIRLDEKTTDKLELLSKLENLDKSIIARQALDIGLNKVSIDIAIKQFVDEKISYSEAAAITDMYIGEFMELLAQRGVQLKPYSPEIKAHLDKSEKHLLQILSDQIKRNKIKYTIDKSKQKSRKKIEK